MHLRCLRLAAPPGLGRLSLARAADLALPDAGRTARWTTPAPPSPLIKQCRIKGCHERRLDWLRRDPATKCRQVGVIAFDYTRIDHDGTPIADVAWFWDHAGQWHLIAHDDPFADSVQVSVKHYPLTRCRCRKRDACAPAGATGPAYQLIAA